MNIYPTSSIYKLFCLNNVYETYFKKGTKLQMFLLAESDKHVFFLSLATDLRLENSGVEELDKILIDILFEVEFPCLDL